VAPTLERVVAAASDVPELADLFGAIGPALRRAGDEISIC